MPGGAARNLSPERVDGLNQELGALRESYHESVVGLSSLFDIVHDIKKDYQLALYSGQVPERHPSHAEELTEEAEDLGAIFEARAKYGGRATGFMGRLQAIILTGDVNGTIGKETLVPQTKNFVDGQGRRYTGDKKGLPRIYVASDAVQGRVVGTMYRPSKKPGTRKQDARQNALGVWVWQNEYQRNMGRQVPVHLNLLDGSVQFVEFVEDCKLPNPETFEDPYKGVAID